MATRIVVICKSHLMPGADNVKNAMMANMACQQIWARDFDNSQDRLITEGGYHLYNQTCSLVIDNGPVDSAEQQILVLKWRDQNLIPIPGPVHVYILNKLRTQFHFNPAERPVRQSYSPDEYRAKFGTEAYENMMRQIEEKKEITRRFKNGEL